MKGIVIIDVQGDQWPVPRGFGAHYKRVLSDGVDVDVLSDLLGLIGYKADPEDVASWTLRQRVEAMVYSANVHLRASDNRLQRHPDLEWMGEPHRGLNGGPTVLT